MTCHVPEDAGVATAARRVALVGSPNAGKTSIFNALTGLHAKTGNYPGVTVARSVGTCQVDGADVVVEDLPGAYGLHPVSPDEQVVADLLAGRLAGVPAPDALVVVADATTLRRSLTLVAEVLALGRPTCVVVTMSDELARRGGQLSVPGLQAALGVPVHRVLGHRRAGIDALRATLPGAAAWPRSPLAPPTEPAETAAWIDSVLAAADYRAPHLDATTERLDRALLHPVWGTITFFAVMFAFFQTIFVVAAPLQGAIETFFGWLAGLVRAQVPSPTLAGLLADGIIGGVGAVLVFVPQIMLLFLLLSLLEGVGYLSRAAFLMDRVMARAGLEGRAFVALLSAVACAIPGIMATRSLPSARDRIATMMAAPLMTCSARLTVYVLLISLLVEPGARVGPFGAQGVLMFALYLLGAVSAMAAAWVFSKVTGRRGTVMPFYMEMPPYRVPTGRSVLVAMWTASKAFVRKAGTIILAVTLALWLMLNLPARSAEELTAAGVDTTDGAAVTSYVMEHSVAAGVGHAIEPVFAPLGFDWHVDIGIISSLAAREVFVSTLGQVAAAQDPDNPRAALAGMTFTDGPHAGEPVLTTPTTVAVLVFFVYAMQCMSTLAVMRRESGGWRWPLTAFAYMSVLAWVMAFLARHLTMALL
ncbi:ferrous iron transporter B [Georgenia ruanii]|uniref:Ferrous iron transporter B n=1 Tax=Georgenia ruanii TaxID=348442 RepID=A0A7J9URX7_9MICO|nr:ferrous iron transporter B [Georgenia ruanii]MPV87365.1 ferrous iron transporter B [Georgenia ruanii]